MLLAALHEYRPASCLLTGSKRSSALHTLSFNCVILLCIKEDGDGDAVVSVSDALSGIESLNHLMLATGLASARHLRLKRLAESSGAIVSGCGLVSSRTSGKSESISVTHMLRDVRGKKRIYIRKVEIISAFHLLVHFH